jgi:hypothetical protein
MVILHCILEYAGIKEKKKKEKILSSVVSLSF